MLTQVSEAFTAADLVYGHGTDNAWDEATYLVLTCADLPDDKSSLDAYVDDATVASIQSLAKERIAQRVPLPYLLRTCQYMGTSFDIEPGLVVPRSPLGFLIESDLDPWLPVDVLNIYDFCCGTGCLGIIAAHYFPHAQVTLFDIDPLAIEVAQRNIDRHELGDRVAAEQVDVTTFTPGARADLILFNPPYVDASDMASLPKEFQAEPKHGLAAGNEGLEVIVPIVEGYRELLTNHGVLVGEVGRSAPALLKRFPEVPFVWLDLPEGGEGVFLLRSPRT